MLVMVYFGLRCYIEGPGKKHSIFGFTQVDYAGICCLIIQASTLHELYSKLLVSPLITPIVIPYIIPYVAPPSKEFRLFPKWC